MATNCNLPSFYTITVPEQHLFKAYNTSQRQSDFFLNKVSAHLRSHKCSNRPLNNQLSQSGSTDQSGSPPSSNRLNTICRVLFDNFHCQFPSSTPRIPRTKVHQSTVSHSLQYIQSLSLHNKLIILVHRFKKNTYSKKFLYKFKFKRRIRIIYLENRNQYISKSARPGHIHFTRLRFNVTATVAVNSVHLTFKILIYT